MVSYFQFVYQVDYINRLSYVEPSLYFWDEAHLIMVDDLLDVFLDSVCEYFVEYICIYVHEGWMDLDKIILSKVTQNQKDKHAMYSLVSGY